MGLWVIFYLKETNTMKNNIIAVDFDGTLCENKYPEIGEPNMELINFLMNCQLICLTIAS